MPSSRILNGVTSGTLSGSDQRVWWFVRIDFGGSVGTKCFTDYHCEKTAEFITLNVAGDGSFNWYCYGMTVGEIKEGDQDAFTVNSLTFANLESPWSSTFVSKQWNKWASSIRKAPVRIYRVHFTPGTSTYEGGYLRFQGELGGAVLDTDAQITVKPSDSSNKEAPFAMCAASCVSVYRDSYCGFVGAEPAGQVTCAKSRKACRDRSNELNFNGFDLMSEKDIHWTG